MGGFSMRRFAAPLIIMFLLLAGIGGFFIGRAGMFHWERDNPRPVKTGGVINSNTGETAVVLFFLKPASTNFYLKPVLHRLKKDGDPHVRALEALFAGPSQQSKLLPIFPKGTKVLGFSLKQGTAYLNLNRSATQLNVGSSTEVLAVASIVNTLTKFPDVFKVKILIEGREVESLGGHVDLTGFLRYNDQVVDPDLL